ncbi:wax ester/triacylglycerol synthase family O-acyltransferase [Pseudomaricurvus alkylphenolicus]|jgi:WS/DGAT/MGAT family acyltransferase|uniref:wax ester/triacylglycerol synthase family O-acyltransferase n=1 Tax=Pseudomaricurvus alkylphenolicus TaxID=1306991 RepID=UPI001421D750|nr:wax ester/triacylglycerol synthase family O-acyltransferase [Pseudomaricurvus alkylphenolicus]NIB38884.1 wax ester/triacylglycerol synthase family O-acyltransferase [Pseudomaricurvus alkylphenolicus]
MEQLRGIDASFIHLERNKNRFQVGTLLFYDVSTASNQFVRFKEILATFRDRITKESLLRKKVQQVPFGLDDPYWVEDDNFDIEYHVRHIALPKPGDWRQLCIQVARIHSRPLDLNRPLWEVYVIEGLDNVKTIPKGGFAMYVKLHHAAIDGIAGNDLISAIHDAVPTPAQNVDDGETEAGTGPSVVDNLTMLTRAATNMAKQPFRFYNLARKLPPAISRIRKGRKQGLFSPVSKSDHTRFNDRVSGHLVMDAAIFPLDELKAVKNAVAGVTINDVMLAIVSGAMSKYLNAKGEPPAQLTAGMPINVRPFLNNVTEQDANNLVSVSKVSLENLVDDPLERLLSIHQAAQETKAYQDALGADIMLEVSRSMPALLVNMASRSLHHVLVSESPLVNTIVTNVPGSQKPLYMAGAKLEGMCNIGVVLDGMGIFHAVSSYCGTATVSFQACRAMMPDPQFYRSCVIDTFEELKTATQMALDSVNESEPQSAEKSEAKPESKSKSEPRPVVDTDNTLETH